MKKEKVLEISDLHVRFETRQGIVRAVDGLDLHAFAGETIGVVGESGCGKSMTARAIMRLVPKPGKITEGTIRYYGTEKENATVDITHLDPDGEKMRSIRGKEIAMIFQEPMVSFSPVHTIGSQIMEAVLLHQNVDKKEAQLKAIELLNLVGIPNPKRRFGAYPFELSGGMRQRAMIAMALSCEPRLLIADEPTTALDVTVQAQILSLLENLQQEFGMAIMLITHNLGVVATTAHRMAVMYLGKMVEEGSSLQIFENPKHPYTWGLMKSVPIIGRNKVGRLPTIEGNVPNPFTRITGCSFHPRCPHKIANLCDKHEPASTKLADGQKVRCFLYDAEAIELEAGGNVQ